MSLNFTSYLRIFQSAGGLLKLSMDENGLKEMRDNMAAAAKIVKQHHAGVRGGDACAEVSSAGCRGRADGNSRFFVGVIVLVCMCVMSDPGLVWYGFARFVRQVVFGVFLSPAGVD